MDTNALLLAAERFKQAPTALKCSIQRKNILVCSVHSRKNRQIASAFNSSL